MKKLCLLLALVLLTGSVPVYGALATQTDPMALPTDAPSDAYALPEGYDPASEEDGGSYHVYSAAYDDYGRTLYAGATPLSGLPVTVAVSLGSVVSSLS